MLIFMRDKKIDIELFWTRSYIVNITYPIFCEFHSEVLYLLHVNLRMKNSMKPSKLPFYGDNSSNSDTIKTVNKRNSYRIVEFNQIPTILLPIFIVKRRSCSS